MFLVDSLHLVILPAHFSLATEEETSKVISQYAAVLIVDLHGVVCGADGEWRPNSPHAGLNVVVHVLVVDCIARQVARSTLLSQDVVEDDACADDRCDPCWLKADFVPEAAELVDQNSEIISTTLRARDSL